MRDYGKVSPTFWTGETGRKLRLLGKDAQIAALYLLTCQSANMIGLYYLPLPTLSHETGISLKSVANVLSLVARAQFAFYDQTSEVVWVPEMAKYQVGEKLDPRDKRIKGIIRQAETYRKCKYFVEFWKKYSEPFHLPEAPSKPLRSQEQEQEQEQEKEHEQEVCSEPSADSEPPFLVFPCSGSGRKTWNLFEAKIAEYCDSFPAVDVRAECRKALQWCRDNPTKVKTHSGTAAFLGRWLSKAQDQSRTLFNGQMAHEGVKTFLARGAGGST